MGRGAPATAHPPSPCRTPHLTALLCPRRTCKARPAPRLRGRLLSRMVPARWSIHPTPTGPQPTTSRTSSTPTFPTTSLESGTCSGAIWRAMGWHQCSSGNLGGGALPRRGQNPNKTLHDELVRYLEERQIGSFYWSLNPDSADTGGLITEWPSMTPENAKLALLSRLSATVVPRAVDRAKPPLPPISSPPPPPPPPATPCPPPLELPKPSSPTPPPWQDGGAEYGNGAADAADGTADDAVDADSEATVYAELSSPREERVIGGRGSLVLGDGGPGTPAPSTLRFRFLLVLVLLLGTQVAVWVWAPACRGSDGQVQILRPRPKAARPSKRPSRRQRQRLTSHDVDESEEENLSDEEEGRLRPTRKARPQRGRGRL